MKRPSPVQLQTVVLCVLLGGVVDFAFNALFVGLWFKMPLTPSWNYISWPVYFALGTALSSSILQSRFKDHALLGFGSFFVGITLTHFILVGSNGHRLYIMHLDTEYDAGKDSVLLRSQDWPQILFITSTKVQTTLNQQVAGTPIDVVMDVITDYGCDRSSVVSTVSGIDVRYDQDAIWTWQVDHQTGLIGEGPGSEDRRFFWCRRPPTEHYVETVPTLRPWEHHLIHPESNPKQ